MGGGKGGGRGGGRGDGEVGHSGCEGGCSQPRREEPGKGGAREGVRSCREEEGACSEREPGNVYAAV